MKKTLRKIKRFSDPWLRKYIDTFMWKFRHCIRSDWKEGYLDSNSLSHPHRELIVDFLRRTPKINRILELGTGSGINLVKMAAYFPTIKYTGIDINKKAISSGIEYLESNGILNVELILGDIFGIKKLESSSVDYILTDAVLMYIDPDDLVRLFEEMIRVSSAGFILCEQMSPGGVYADHWRHDYGDILAKLEGVGSFSISKIPERYWDGDWIKYGCIIEVEKMTSLKS